MGRPSLSIIAAAVCLAATPAAAVEPTGGVVGTVTVRHAGEAVPADGVILYVVGFAEPPPAGVRPIEIHQRDKTFVPDLVAVTVGERVSFPNDDPFFHNVFSPSPTRQFDLGSYPRGETKLTLFPSVGVVEVYCNIHPQMAASVLVLPNRRFTRAGADGRFAIDGIPPGHWTLYAYSRRATRPTSVSIDVAAGATARVELAVEETRESFEHPTKYGEPYRDPARYR